MTFYLAQVTTTATPAPITMPDTSGLMALAGAYSIFALVGLIITIVCNFIIARKAGFNPWLSLLVLIPIVNIIIYLLFVFVPWPVNKELKRLRSLGAPPV
jgi:choline-glycine betaine transporter